MTPQRINELIQILWNDVDNAEDLQAFVQKYGHELDADFMAGIAAVIQQAEEAGDDNAAGFFRQVGQALVSILASSDEEDDGEAAPQNAVKRAAKLVQQLAEEVNSNEDLARFAAQHLHECDDVFFGVLQQVVEGQKAEGNEENVRFFEQTGQALRHIRQEILSHGGGQAGFSGQEAQIKAEDDVIAELRKTDPNAAYLRATANLERAEQTGNDILIGACAFTLARVARKYRPYPRLSEAISAYEIAAEKALSIGNEEAYRSTQNNMGNEYLRLPTGNRGENLRNAIRCYKNALQICSEKNFPQNYAATQNNIGNEYLRLPSGDQGENLRNAIRCYKNALRIRTKKDFPQDYAMTQNNLGNAYSYLPIGDRGENLRKAVRCYENALRVYSENDFPQEYAGTQDNLGVAYLNLPTGDRGENLRNAVRCHENALRVYSENDFPQDYAATQNNLGNAYLCLPTGDRGENLRNAVLCYENALRVYSENDFPQDHAATQNNLGGAYWQLPSGDRGENLRNAIQCYQNALRIRIENDFPQDRVETLYNLALAYDEYPLNDWHKAYDTCAQAIDVLETRVRAVSSAETRRAVAEKEAKIYHRMVSLCIRMGKTEEALSYAERGKSRTLVEMLHAAQLTPSEKVPEDVRNAFVAVRDKLEELHRVQEAGETVAVRDFEITGAETPDSESFSERRIIFRSFPASLTAPREEISTLRQETQQAYDALLRQISESDSEFAASERVQPISVSEIQEMIPEKTVFVECFTGSNSTYLFVLDGKSDISENYMVLEDLTHAELFNNLATENWLSPYYDYLKNQTSETREAWHNTIETTPGPRACSQKNSGTPKMKPANPCPPSWKRAEPSASSSSLTVACTYCRCI